MLTTGIEGYVGSWVSASGQKIIVEKRGRRYVAVTLIGVDGRAIVRPYTNDAPAEKLRGRYDDVEGVLDVELWFPRSGFVLSLIHEFEYLPNGTWHHFLASALVRNEADAHLDAYYAVFGKLETYVPEPNKEPL